MEEERKESLPVEHLHHHCTALTVFASVWHGGGRRGKKNIKRAERSQ